MSGTSRYGVPAFDRPHRMVKGVCATIAVLAGVPVWTVRVAAVVLLALHACVAMIGYFLVAYIWRCNIRTVLAGGGWTADPWGGSAADRRPTDGEYWRGRRMP